MAKKINFGYSLFKGNLVQYGCISDLLPPWIPHKGQSLLREMVKEHIFPLVTKKSVVLDLGCRNLDLVVFLEKRVGKMHKCGH